jgi:hypothetical protein
LRFWWLTFWYTCVGSPIISAVFAYIISLLWPPLGYLFWLFWPMSALILILLLLFDRHFICPRCRKAVKDGASHCHHCGCNVDDYYTRLGTMDS